MPGSRRASLWFALWWLALTALHAICIAYYVVVANLYRSVIPGSTLAYQLRVYSIGVPESQYMKIAAAHDAVWLLHAFSLLLMILGTLQRRRLAYYLDVQSLHLWVVTKTKTRIHLQRQIRIVPEIDKEGTSILRSASTRLSKVFNHVGNGFFGRSGVLGPDFAYFDHMLLVREVLETSLQTYQAFRMTQLLPRLWLNRVYVILLVINCWSIPILHRVYHHQHRMRRLMSLLCDSVLDVLSSMGVSFLIYLTYAPQYTDPAFGFPFEKWFDEMWFTSVYQEFQMMLIVSWGDMASRLVFAIGVLQCTRSIKNMLLLDSRSSDTQVQPNVDDGARAGPVAVEGLREPTSPSLGTSSRSMRGVVDFMIRTAGPGVFCLWGAAILFTHIYAESRGSALTCRLPLRPWLTHQAACSLVDIDCSMNDDSSRDHAWAKFDPHLAAGIHIVHCEKLTIPSSIQDFVGVVSIKLYNSSIASWSADASLTSTAHARLRNMYFVRTNFSNGTLPFGLVDPDFPQSFRSFYACKTNLASLPDDLHLVWPRYMLISLEFSAFDAVPDVIPRLLPESLSFSQTQIASIPPAVFEIPTLAELILVGMPLQELPRNVSHISDNLYLLLLGGTNISTFWSWIDPLVSRALWYGRNFFDAIGTPYCEERAEIEEGKRTSFSTFLPNSGQSSVMDVSTPEKLAFVEKAVSCSFGGGTLYAFELDDAASGFSSEAK